jgi:hypothetical protein
LTAGLVSFFSWWLTSVLRCVTQRAGIGPDHAVVGRQGRDSVARTVGHQASTCSQWGRSPQGRALGCTGRKMSPYLNPYTNRPMCLMRLTASNLTQIGMHGPLRYESGMRYQNANHALGRSGSGTAPRPAPHPARSSQGSRPLIWQRSLYSGTFSCPLAVRVLSPRPNSAIEKLSSKTAGRAAARPSSIASGQERSSSVRILALRSERTEQWRGPGRAVGTRVGPERRQ